GKRERAAAAEREPVDRRDRRLAHRLEEERRCVPEPAPLAGLEHGETLHVLDVGAGDERSIARPGQHDRMDTAVVRELAQAVAKRSERLQVERVHRLGPVHGHDRDGVVALDVDHAGAGTFCCRKSTIAETGAPGVNTSATPCSFKATTSAFGIVPPTTTSTSSRSFSRSPSRIFGTSVMCAPERIEMPTAFASS